MRTHVQRGQRVGTGAVRALPRGARAALPRPRGARRARRRAAARADGARVLLPAAACGDVTAGARERVLRAELEPARHLVR